LLNGAKVGDEEAIAAIAGDSPEIVRLFDERGSAFKSRIDEPNLLPRPFEPQDFELSAGSPKQTTIIQAWIEYALSFTRTGIARWMTESKLPDVSLFRAAFWRARAVVPLSNNFEALLMFVDCGGHLPLLLTPEAMRGAHKEGLIESGHATMLALISEIAAAAQLPNVFEVEPQKSGRKRVFTNSALAHAAKSGSLRVVECILAAAPAGFTGGMIASAIVKAFRSGYVDVAQFLLSKIDAADLKASIEGILLKGAGRGATEIWELLVPYMTELTDIRCIILAAVEAGNVDLAKCLIGWQRERSPELSLDEILLTGIRAGDLEIARLIGAPKPDLVPAILELAIEAGFFEGVKYALDVLPTAEQAAVLERLGPKAAQSPTPEIRSLFPPPEDGVGDGDADGEAEEEDLADEGYGDSD
jgi:hypothetical protein